MECKKSFSCLRRRRGSERTWAMHPGTGYPGSESLWFPQRNVNVNEAQWWSNSRCTQDWRGLSGSWETWLWSWPELRLQLGKHWLCNLLSPVFGQSSVDSMDHQAATTAARAHVLLWQRTDQWRWHKATWWSYPQGRFVIELWLWLEVWQRLLLRNSWTSLKLCCG